MNANRRQLLQYLVEEKGQFVSGEMLSNRLNISRTAVWKYIEDLKSEGFQIEAVRKKGYRLIQEPAQISASTLLPHLSTEWVGQHIHVFERSESTQQEAKRLARTGSSSGTVVLAEQQTNGKGRLGRPWHSPPGTGIWLSLLVRPDLVLSKIPQLTLLSAVAATRALRQVTHLDIGIKWPNDLLINRRKVAGILTELDAESDRVHVVLIGIGINVNQKTEDFPADLQQGATSLAMEAGKPIDRKACLIHVLEEWERLYELYLEKGFRPIKTLWETYSVSLGQRVIARTMEGQYEGRATGITDEGILLLEEANGNIRQIYSADLKT